MASIAKSLRYYFITDDGPTDVSPVEQVRIALETGATMVQYRNKAFNMTFYDEVTAIRELCRRQKVPLVINDHILLAKAIGADGVHLGQGDDQPAMARRVLGPGAIVGLSVSTLEELARSSLDGCDYIGTGPVFGTRTKADAKPRRGLEGLKAMVDQSPLPVVAIGGITADNAMDCLNQGAAGVAVISVITRAADPSTAARKLAAVISAA
jgi:thiamine-phosphate pyrophosphorylase